MIPGTRILHFPGNSFVLSHIDLEVKYRTREKRSRRVIIESGLSSVDGIDIEAIMRCIDRGGQHRQQPISGHY
ncbi:MAG: hypothetical protein JRD05_09500 [Deltaproteobacteria bacterium]|nr:hypothetical protein [Deltaproteobacteria bacterium]